jgi:hypothetical protein
MAHDHGKEYQIRMVHEDGTEDLSGWMQRAEQVAPALTAIHRPQGTAYWLRARTILCPDCLARDQRIWECPLTGIPSSRYSPHDAGYFQSVGERSRSEANSSGERSDDWAFNVMSDRRLLNVSDVSAREGT